MEERPSTSLSAQLDPLGELLCGGGLVCGEALLRSLYIPHYLRRSRDRRVALFVGVNITIEGALQSENISASAKVDAVFLTC